MNRMVLLNCTVTKNMAFSVVEFRTDVFALPNTELLTPSSGTIVLCRPEQFWRLNVTLNPTSITAAFGTGAGWSGHAINSDPRLRSNGKIGWLSPCIDAGDVSLYPGMNSDPYNRRNYDIEGRDRVRGIDIDMGAFEVEPLRVFEGPFVHLDVDIRP